MTKRSFLIRIAALGVSTLAIAFGNQPAGAARFYRIRHHRYWLWRHRRWHRRRFF